MLVDIRTLFTVYFDRYKIGIENLCGLLILEGFPLHHMAPVAGAVTDAQKDRFVLFLRLCKGLFAPGVPVYRIVSMLLKIGRVFVLEMVCHFVLDVDK